LRPQRPGTAWLASCLALASCATAPAAGTAARGPGIDPELAAQLRAMATRQTELEHKLDRLEGELEAMRVAPRRSEAVGASPSVSGASPVPAAAAPLVPEHLATVRLAPPSAAGAPALPTSVALREPDDSAMGQLDPEPDTRSEEYEAALAAISTGEVPRGAQGLQAFADKYPRDERAPLALLQAGVGLLTYGDPQSAVLAFDRVAQDYPQAREAPEAMMRMADCQLRLKRTERAKDVWALVMSRYPGTPAARAAAAGIKSLSEAKAKAAQ